jgi:hypothetical protein
MRPTWLILGLIVVAGAVTYLNLMDGGEDSQGPAASAPPASGSGAPALQRASPAGAPAPAAAPAPSEHADEERAVAILREVTEAREARDRARYDERLAALQAEAWDAPSARLFAVHLGRGLLQEADELAGAARVRQLDRARRLLSRGVFLEAYFDAQGRSTAERKALIQDIQRANEEVMSYRRHEGGGLDGVTRAYVVPPGIAPVQIVSRQRLPYGHNAILWWSHHGNLDPTRIKAGEVLLLPLEVLTLHVLVDRTLLAIFIGDWFVKEFRIGVGMDESPTPLGEFVVVDKHENPDWWYEGEWIPYGDPRNELGSTWIELGNDAYRDAGYGIHGTIKPETVGTRCSNGCVRLLNPEASEIFWWVRRGNNGAEATRVFIRRR